MTKINTLSTELQSIALQKKELANKEEVIKAALLEAMHKEGLDKLTVEYGTISRGVRTSYKFTEAIKKLEDKVKIKKDEEIKKGLAEPKTTEYLSFRESVSK